MTIIVSNVSVDILPAYRQHLNYHIISLREETWAHKTSLTPTLFIEVPVLVKEGETVVV